MATSDHTDDQCQLKSISTKTQGRHPGSEADCDFGCRCCGQLRVLSLHEQERGGGSKRSAPGVVHDPQRCSPGSRGYAMSVI